MYKAFTIVGLFWAILSVVHLLVAARSETGLVGPFKAITELFDDLLFYLLIWADPLVRLLGQELARLTGIRIEVFDHWRYLFSLLLLYVGAQAKHAFSNGFAGFALFRLCCGTVVACLAAPLFGAFAFSDQLAPLYLPVILGAAFAAYQLCNSYWIAYPWKDKDISVEWPGFRFSYHYPALFLTYGSITALIAVPLHSFIDTVPLSVLAVFLFFLLVVAHWHVLGYIYAKRERIKPTFKESFWAEGPTRVGKPMVDAFLGGILFLIGNAGWALVASSIK